MSFKAIYTLAGAAILALGLVTGTPPAAVPGAVAEAGTAARG